MRALPQNSRAFPFVDTLVLHAPALQSAWLERSLPPADSPFDRELFFAVLASAGRRFRPPPLRLGPEGHNRLLEAGVLDPAVWLPAEFARAALLLRATEILPRSEHPTLIQETFRKGDNAERSAVLRTLNLLPAPGRFLTTAVESCRSDVRDVFEAMACENPYPALHFPEENFNQLVMKSLFLGTRVPRIHDWSRRCNPELVRMARDYSDERRAAGRTVPEDISLIVARGES